MSAPLIQLSEVSLGFGKHDIFKNIDLVLNKGARACLVGRNGSGTVSYTHLTLPTNREV